jgi:hypothetical protein
MTGSLPKWLAEVFGVPASPSADAATWRLDTAWHWAPWATVLLILAAVFWTALLYAREATSASRPYRVTLGVLRFAAICLALIMLAQWALAVRITGPPALALVIDRSASMSIADRYNDPALSARLNERLSAAGLGTATRLDLAKLLLNEDDGRLLRELAARYRLEVYAAAVGTERLSDASDQNKTIGEIRGLTTDGPEGQSTRLGDAVRHVLEGFRGAPPAAIILLSDGVTTEGVPLADAAQEARHRGVPILAVGLGSSEASRDIELADVLLDDAVFVNDLVSVQAQIKATGLAGQPARVTLRRQGASDAIAEQSVTLPAAGETLAVRLVDRPTEPGDITYVIDVALRDDEIDKQNNRQEQTVSVRDDKIRVLLAQGYPSYEFRFLKTLLERDPTIQLSTYLQDADPEYAEQDKTALRSFPVSREELLEYDVLVIGDVDPRLLPRSVWQNVKAFVAEKGGGAAFLAGPRYLPWLYRDNPEVAALLPIDVRAASESQLPAAVTQGYTVGPSPLGLQSAAMQLGDTPEQSQQIWSQLAPLFWLAPIGELKPGAQVLAEGPPSISGQGRSAYPLICFQYVGGGRVLFHAFDSTWRWRIGAGDTFFARYWVQTMRVLARGKLSRGRGVQLTTDRREYQRGEVAQLRARFLDPRRAPAGDEITVLIDSPGETRRRIILRRNRTTDGVFEGSAGDLAEGQYSVMIVEPQLPGNPPATRFTVVAPPGEYARPEMDDAALKLAADTTHGKFYTIADADRLLADLPVGRRVPIENLPPIPLWNRWWLLTAFLVCVTTEWVLRKRKGML